MLKKSFMDLYLSGIPIFKKLIDIGEWFLIILVGFLFPHPRILLFPFTNITGIILIIIGIWIHKLSHKAHPKAHRPKEEIEKLVTTGIYSKIRHPGYTGYIICYFGVFLLFGFLSMLFPILIFSYIFYDSAKKEESFLMNKFGQGYDDYMKKVPWRFIPKIF